MYKILRTYFIHPNLGNAARKFFCLFLLVLILGLHEEHDFSNFVYFWDILRMMLRILCPTIIKCVAEGPNISFSLVSVLPQCDIVYVYKLKFIWLDLRMNVISIILLSHARKNFHDNGNLAGFYQFGWKAAYFFHMALNITFRPNPFSLTMELSWIHTKVLNI